MKKINNRPNGFTIVELMIGILIGLIIIGGASSVFLTTIASSTSTLKMSKLNQELNTVMSIITNDIRRSGYVSTIGSEDPSDNDFNLFGATALSVRTSIDNDVNPGPQGWGNCILFSYDKNKSGIVDDGIVDDNELFGFRLNGAVVEMRTATALGTAIDLIADTVNDSCNTGTWVEITDSQLISVDTLIFDLGPSACLNVSNMNEIDDGGASTIDEEEETNCYHGSAVIDDDPSDGSSDITVEVRVVDLTLVGSLINDTLMKTSLSHSVRIRNDLVRRR